MKIDNNSKPIFKVVPKLLVQKTSTSTTLQTKSILQSQHSLQPLQAMCNETLGSIQHNATPSHTYTNNICRALECGAWLHHKREWNELLKKQRGRVRKPKQIDDNRVEKGGHHTWSNGWCSALRKDGTIRFRQSTRAWKNDLGSLEWGGQLIKVMFLLQH